MSVTAFLIVLGVGIPVSYLGIGLTAVGIELAKPFLNRKEAGQGREQSWAKYGLAVVALSCLIGCEMLGYWPLHKAPLDADARASNGVRYYALAFPSVAMSSIMVGILARITARRAAKNNLTLQDQEETPSAS